MAYYSIFLGLSCYSFGRIFEFQSNIRYYREMILKMSVDYNISDDEVANLHLQMQEHYLQENQGGHTEFNKLNIKVGPKKGRLLVFYNTEKDSNKLHDLSMHSGNEVLSGEKWACNIWFRDNKYNC